MKKYLILALVLPMLFIGITGCGKDKKENKDNEKNEIKENNKDKNNNKNDSKIEI